MQWDIADKVCSKEFNGSGYIHLAADIPEGTRDYTLNTMENYRSVWLDNLAYDLGCRGNSLEFFSFLFFLEIIIARIYDQLYSLLVCFTVKLKYMSCCQKR